jgi:hypothetical protein
MEFWKNLRGELMKILVLKGEVSPMEEGRVTAAIGCIADVSGSGNWGCF